MVKFGKIKKILILVRLVIKNQIFLFFVCTEGECVQAGVQAVSEVPVHTFFPLFSYTYSTSVPVY